MYSKGDTEGLKDLHVEKASEKDRNYTNQGFIQGCCQGGETIDNSKRAAPSGVLKYAPSLKFGFSEVSSGFLDVVECRSKFGLKCRGRGGGFKKELPAPLAV